MSDLEKLIEGRKAAQAAIELVTEDQAESLADDDYSRGYLREILRVALEQADERDIPKGESLPTMTEVQAAQFERLPIRFGKHSGMPFGEVPIAYLAWVAEGGSQLASCLRSERGQERQGHSL